MNPPTAAQVPVPVAFLGPEGTFASLAVRRVHLVPHVDPIPLPGVVEVIDAVESGQYAYGLVPLDNSVEGVVTPTLDRLVFHTRHVLGVEEVVVPVTFTAFAAPAHRQHPGPWTVTSHPHALAQCQRFVAAQGAPALPASSTAAACAAVAAADSAAGSNEGPNQPPLLALAAPEAGACHHLVPVASQVEDHPGAATRFLLLARGVAPADGQPCNTLLVVTPPDDHVGVLMELLTVVAHHELNLASLVVRPLKRHLDRFTFVLTVQGHIAQPALRACVLQLLADGHAVKLLGSYRLDPSDVVTPQAPLPAGSLRAGDPGVESALLHPPVVGAEV